MSELSPDARDLIAQARKQGPELLGPSAEQRARLRERLTPLWAAEAPAVPARSGLRWKLASAVVIIAGLGALGAVFLRAEPEPVLRASSSSQQPAPAGVPEHAAAATAPAPAAANTGLPPTAASAAVAHTRRASDAALPEQPVPPPTGSGSAAARTRRAPPAAHPEQSGSPPAAAGSAVVRPRRAPEGAPPEQPVPPPTAAGARARVRPSALTSSEEPVPPGRPDRKAVTDTGGPDVLAVVPVQSVDSSAVNDQVAPVPAESARAPERSARERGLAAEARRTQLQPARAERLPLTAAEDHTRARNVDTEQDPAPPSIDGELELLGAAQAALQKQRPSRALTLLQEHAFRFPTGSLVEERMAMQALALCALQRRHAAATVLESLEARGSTSQLLPRVRSQCGL